MPPPVPPPDGAARPSGGAVFCLVFLPFALGHFLSCLMRTVNAMLAPQLVAALALTPGQLGLLASVFYFAFALAQLPVGFALDRFGPRRVQCCMLLVAAAGALAFAGGRNFAELMWARALVGLGLGGCFMSAVKAVSAAVAPARLPSVHGCLIAVGGLGAAAATLPVRLALRYTDWRGLFLGLAAAAAGLSLLMFLLAPPTAPERARPPALRAIPLVYRHPVFRETAALVLLPHTVFFGLQGLWLGRWLNDVAGLSEDAVAWLLYLSMAAIMAGAIGVGMVAEWAGRRGVRPAGVAAAGIALFLAVQLGFVFDYAPSHRLLPVLFTLAGSVAGIEYAIVAQGMPAALTGRAATCLNLLIFLGAFAVQAGFGLVVGCWAPGPGGHSPPQAYQAAFGLVVLLQLPGLIWFLRKGRKFAGQSGKMDLPALTRMDR